MRFHCIKMSQYFPKPYEPFGGDSNVKDDLSNYATKSDLRNAKGIDTSKLAAKSDLVNLKTEVDKLDIAKLETTPVDLSKLSNVVKMRLLKRLNIMLWSKILKTKYLILLI